MMSNLLAAPKRLSLWALIFVIAVMLSACGEAGHEEGAANAQPVTLSREIPDADQRRGRELIAQYGCGSCHKIPGIAKADGNVGPPLNDWADRQYIAGSLPNTPDNLIYWIRFPQAVEPGTVMPNMDLSPEDARDMAAFLYTLQDAGQISDIFATPRAWVQGAIAPEDDQVPVTGEEGGQEGGQEGGRLEAKTSTQKVSRSITVPAPSVTRPMGRELKAASRPWRAVIL